MQYLKSNLANLFFGFFFFFFLATVSAERDEPYCVQSILQFPLPRLSTDELLHCLQLVFAARLESTGVVENISLVIRKDKFVLDVVQAALEAGSSRSAHHHR
jgi:hypothetical protein